MSIAELPELTQIEAAETQDWIDSLNDVLAMHGPERVRWLLHELQIHAQKEGVELPVTSQTPYVNTINVDRQPPFPGDREIERRIKSLVRWNAMAMVTRANKAHEGIGGHISTFASAATLYEVGFNHFFRGRDHECGGDLVFFQGHASPGIYSRAFLEGRLSKERVMNFRRELAPGGGLSSYPHPWLMPDFWQFPTVSMGLGPLQAIYQARFMRYLSDRGINQYNGAKVFAFLGDGECDEPETLGAINLASRERLDNLVFVINCNLQRLDGPVRGNGSIVQELEAGFRGAGWNVVKCLWGSDYDPLLGKDTDGRLARRMGELVDGQRQKYAVEGGAYVRKHFYGVDPRLEALVKHIDDKTLWKLRLGGHDPVKVHASYQNAMESDGQPTVILARTIKGYGLAEAGEGKNISHNQKKLNESEMLEFRDRFEIPLTDKQVKEDPLYRPDDKSVEIQYLQERRRALGGYVPSRRMISSMGLEPVKEGLYDEFYKGSGDRPISTTMAYVRIISKLLRDKSVGKYIVPIIPDEARTFGMEGMFRQFGIYSHVGQLYEPVDADQISYYKETTDGQILEEGINEAGSICSFIAAGTSYSVYDKPMIPFYIYYSMFGPQRIGDFIWAAGDMKCRGFLIGGTCGRTTLNGEGLQHEDGHSHVILSTIPVMRCYDPAYAYELAIIIEQGLKEMYFENKPEMFYISVHNENYVQPAMPENFEEVKDGIIKGMYKLSTSSLKKPKAKAQLFGSSSILQYAIKAAEILEGYGVAADVWSVTSYVNMRRDALDCERWNMLHPEEEEKVPYFSEMLKDEEGALVFTGDNMKILSDGLSKWVEKDVVSLGTDGFGRSESRANLRDFFEVDEKYVVLGTLWSLAKSGDIDKKVVSQAIKDLGIDPEKANPMHS